LLLGRRRRNLGTPALSIDHRRVRLDRIALVPAQHGRPQRIEASDSLEWISRKWGLEAAITSGGFLQRR